MISTGDTAFVLNRSVTRAVFRHLSVHAFARSRAFIPVSPITALAAAGALSA